MTSVSKRACVRKKRNVYTHCKILYRKSNRCIAINFVWAHNATIANVYQFVKRFRDRMKALVIDHHKAFEMRNTISRSMKRLRKSVILEMKNWRRDEKFISSTTNWAQSCICRFECDLIRALERQIKLE